MTDKENDELWNSYFYPNTNVLINKLNIKTFDELKKIEVETSFKKLIELKKTYPKIDLDKKSLRFIHRYILEDIYPFAGEYRIVNMTKRIGAFLKIENEESIPNYLDTLFDEIKIKLTSCSSKFEFSEILAKLYTNLIYCHPFREANGRAIKEFVREISIIKSKEIGLDEMELNWKLIDPNVLISDLEVVHFFPGNISIAFYEALKKTKKEGKTKI